MLRHFLCPKNNHNIGQARALDCLGREFAIILMVILRLFLEYGYLKLKY